MPAIAAISPHHKAIEAYYAELADFHAHYATYEQATRAAFEHLLLPAVHLRRRRE